GRLGSHTEPVLRPLGNQVNMGRLGFRVVRSDLFDHPSVALLMGVYDDHAVKRVADFAHPLEANLDCHECGVSLRLSSERLSSGYRLRRVGAAGVLAARRSTR